VIAAINKFLTAVAAALLSILPDDPFMPFINQIGSQTWLPILNWFIPIGLFISIGTAWLLAIGVYGGRD